MNYVDRNNKPITMEQWEALHRSPNYVSVRQYIGSDEEQTHASLMWTGVVGAEFLFNTGGDNVIVRIESEGISLYEDFLAEHECGSWVPSSIEPGKSNFLEHGNRLEQPTRDGHADLIASNDLYGSW